MTSVQHSVLLKFFKDTTNMSERKEGIESRVPKEQEIRGDKEIQEEIARAGEVEMKEFSQEPVIKVTREESSFMKGDLKVEKLRVTENIANGTTKIISVTETSEPNEEQILYREMTTMKTECDEQRREGFQRAVHRVTKIPQFKFKHTVDKIKKQEEMIKEGKDEANLALRVVEVVQETKNDKKHLQEQQNDKIQSPNTEDEFDRIYDEICDGPQSGNFTTPEKIEDLDRLENKFEEIMNDYDKQREQKEQTGSGRVRSKIPLMKRKSDQDIDVSKSTFRRNSLKRLSSVDDAKNIICKIPEPVVREKRKQEESIQNNTVTSLNSDTVVQTETVSVKTFTLARKVATSASETISTQKSHEIVQGIENDLITHRDLTGSRIPKHFKNINGKETKMQATEIKSESRTEKINEDMKINRNETKEMKTTTIKDYTITLNIKDNISKVETKPIIIENVKILGNNDEKTQKDFQQTTADKQSHTDNIQQKVTSAETTNKEDNNNNNVVLNKHVTNLDSKTSQEEDSTNTVVEEQTNSNSDIKETSSLSTLECDKENTLDTRKEDLDQSISRTTHTNIQENELKETVNVVTLEFPKALVSESQNVSNDYRSQVLSTSNDISEITEFEILRTGAEIKYKGDVESKLCDKNVVKVIHERVEQNHKQTEHREDERLENNININNISQENDCHGKESNINKKIELKESITNNIEHSKQGEKEGNTEGESQKNITTKEGTEKEIRNGEYYIEKYQNMSPEKLNDLQEEDIIILKGKVKRVMNRLNSREFRKRETESVELPADVSVVNKIALFEQSRDSLRRDGSEDKIKKDLNKPKIVDDILKTGNKETSEDEKNMRSDSRREESFSYNTFLNYKNNYKRGMSIQEYNINLNNIEDEKKNILQKKETAQKDNERKDILKEYKINKEKDSETKRARAAAENNYQGVRGRVREMVMRMNSIDKMMTERREGEKREGERRRRRQGSVTETIALFEKKVPAVRQESISTASVPVKKDEVNVQISDEELLQKIVDLEQAVTKYGSYKNMTYVELSDGARMPTLAVGTALLDSGLVKPIIKAAISLGYRAIDSAFIYANERAVGEAVREKIQDGTVKREDLFIISKLWSTNHRRDLVPRACRQSLETMGLDYFDLYLIHNPMSFKEGANPVPKIANVIQYSEHDYLEAWYGVETCIKQGLVRRGGVSNFNSVQVQRVLDKGRIKPVINQVECHPYLSQSRLHDYLTPRGVSLSCFGVLGSSGTPRHLRSALPPVIGDPLVRTMAAGLGVTPAQLLISYQVHMRHQVVVKASSAAHLHDNLLALQLHLEPAHVAALSALNRNKRTFTFQGMGDTHKNYPFKIPF